MIATPSVKRCSKCECVKSIEDFPFREHGRRRTNCRKCHNEWVQKNRKRSEVKCCRAEYYQKNKERIVAQKVAHGIENRFMLALQRIASFSIREGYAPCIATEEEITELFTGFCHACGTPEVECNVKLCLDHDHFTGQARGWLCADCNKALGFLRDSAERALLLAEYAEKHS